MEMTNAPIKWARVDTARPNARISAQVTGAVDSWKNATNPGEITHKVAKANIPEKAVNSVQWNQHDLLRCAHNIPCATMATYKPRRNRVAKRQSQFYLRTNAKGRRIQEVIGLAT